MTQPDDSPEPAPVETAQVELAYPMDIDGTRYDADAVVTVPLHHHDRYAAVNATQLVADGRARWHTPAADEQPVDEPPPPRSGAGSGRDAWAAYAGRRGVPVTDDMSRDDIAAAVEATGTTSQQDQE